MFSVIASRSHWPKHSSKDAPMCYDLAEYDPFVPLFILDGGDGEYLDSEPMTEDDWEA